MGDVNTGENERAENRKKEAEKQKKTERDRQTDLKER